MTIDGLRLNDNAFLYPRRNFLPGNSPNNEPTSIFPTNLTDRNSVFDDTLSINTFASNQTDAIKGKTVDQQARNGKPIGEAIANTAEKIAKQMDNEDRCYEGVARTLQKFGVVLYGKSAYKAASQLKRNPKFQEIKVKKNELKELPAGAIVVWDRGKKHKDGHISIASGDGHQFSSKVRDQITNYGTKHRVFIPKEDAFKE